MVHYSDNASVYSHDKANHSHDTANQSHDKASQSTLENACHTCLVFMLVLFSKFHVNTACGVSFF